MSEDRFYRIALGALHSLTAAKLSALEEKCPTLTPQSLFNADDDRLRQLLGGKLPAALSRANRDKALRETERELEWMQAHNIRPLCLNDDDYPIRLAECDDAPLCLFSLGSTDLNAPAVISIVGTRRATAYGLNFVNKAVSELVASLQSPPLVVSGLALGIDISAHRAALSAGTPTLAVMGTSLNNIYPSCHRQDAIDIVEHGGMLLSEYRSIDATHRGNFLARNRIVAGLADVTIIVESDIKGGAMCTARLAGEYNRAVGALPGRIGDRFSRGCNEMIVSQRAAMVRDAADIISLTRWAVKESSPEDTTPSLFPDIDETESRIIDLLTSTGDMHLMALADHFDMPFHQLSAKLMSLEFKRLIISVPGGMYTLA